MTAGAVSAYREGAPDFPGVATGFLGLSRIWQRQTRPGEVASCCQRVAVLCEEAYVNIDGRPWCLGVLGGILLVAPPAQANTARITAIQLHPTGAGLELQLTIPGGEPAQVFQSRYGSTLIFDIVSTRLDLASADAFRQANPMDGIAEIEVSALDTNSVRVRITGTEDVPSSQTAWADEGLTVTLSPAVTAAADPAGAEDSAPFPATAEAPTAEPIAPGMNLDEADAVPTTAPTTDGAPLRIVVTASRSEEEESAVTRSLTVIPREQIEEQAALSRNLGDILGQLVPGLAPGNQSFSEFGQSLRGRNPLVLIDGVPQSTNRNAFRNLRIIDPSAVERIEVLRGPTALYGDGATGGIINIITRPGGEGETAFNATVGLTGSLSNLNADSLGGTAQLGASGRDGNLDYRFSGSFESIGSLFDGQGDRIPADQLSTQGSLTDTNNFNVFGRLGWDLDDHRLQLTFNHFSAAQVSDFITDPIVNTFPPGEQKALARPGLRLDEQSAVRNTFVNLDYSHPDLFWNSRAHAQLYYRDYLTRFFPFDGGRFGITTPEGFRIFQSRVESQELGARFELETPLMAEQLTLLTGLDYANEDSVQPVRIFDSGAFDASNGLVFEPIGDRPWVPPLNQENLGLFAQLRWQPFDNLLVRGGLRYETIGVSADTFTTLNGATIPGGNLNYDATLFNLGAAYSLSDQVDIFADYAQGFSVADVGLVLRGAQPGFSVESLNPEAQRVNSYEVGIRGRWDTLQASLSGFYNQSNLGTTFNRQTLAVVRAPERIYGVEAALDAQVADTWQLGSTFSWVEGENDVNEDGTYQALTGFRIPPIKLTAYVENETLPGWRNRLQVLYSGSRDRAFDAGVDFRPVNDYVTLDFISSLELGRGTLQLGVQNLLNNQYFTAPSQLLRLRTNDSFTAAPGTTVSVQYGVEF